MIIKITVCRQRDLTEKVKKYVEFLNLCDHRDKIFWGEVNSFELPSCFWDKWIAINCNKY